MIASHSERQKAFRDISIYLVYPSIDRAIFSSSPQLELQYLKCFSSVLLFKKKGRCRFEKVLSLVLSHISLF